jgi:alpha-L-rhamnosidase
MIRFCFIFLFVSKTLLGFTQSPVQQWNAQWITHPSIQLQAHAVVHFRKTFDLATKPQSFVVHLSADNHYRFFVNGQYVGRGPARGDISHWFYDSIDIAPHLVAGSNTLAVEVVNWGPKRSFTYFSQMTSFILQGNTSIEEKLVNTAGGKWKVFHNEAITGQEVDWIFDKTTIDFGLYVGNPTDIVVAAKYPWNWEKPNFDDSKWLDAKWADISGGRDEQFAGGILYGGGKLLIPRRTGYLHERPEPLGKIVRTSGITVDEGFFKGKSRLIIPANQKVSLLIDQSYETMGYPEMTLSGGQNSRVQTMYSENLIVKNKSAKGDRNNLEGKYMVGLKDVFYPDGGQNRLFKPLYLRAFRFIQLDIETKDEPLIIESYKNILCTAPIELKAKFETDEPRLAPLMKNGWQTASICAQDMLMSDAAYEQMQYTGDSRVHNLTLLTLSGDDRLTRNALIQFDESRIPEGLTYACYPNPFHLIIPSYSLIWIDQVHDYMLWKNDPKFIARFELGIHNVLDWFERRRQPNGLLGKIDWWPALAWPRHYKNGVPLDMAENNTLYSLHYAYTLRHAAEILGYLGKNQQAQTYQNRANDICKAINLLCRKPDGFYKESPTDERVSQITNLLAILADATNAQEAKKLMGALLEPKDWHGQVDLFLHLYLFEAMNKTGRQDKFLDELSEWHLMTDRGMSTFAEVPLEWGEEDQRSECHPWSTSPNYFFFRTVCGIKPTSAGHQTVEISPAFGKLTRIEATYPHHAGELTMNLTRNGNKLNGQITVPQGMKATLVWNGKKIILKNGQNML